MSRSPPPSRPSGPGSWALNFFLILFLIKEATAFLTCPSVCTCKWKNGKQYVECRSQGQISIPDRIATETQVLDLSGNNLQSLPREVFARHGLVNLQKLYLSNCSIGQIDPSAFRGLTNLVELDLSANLLTAVPTATFADIPYLRDLHLNLNPLSKIEANAFDMVKQLVTLDLSHCRIKRIAAKAFVELGQLQKLKLNHNHLTELKQRTVDTIQGLHEIGLSSNPWNCDCSLRPLKLWLVTDNVPYTLEPICAGPPRLSGKTFGQLHVDEFACAPEVISMPRYVEAKQGKNASILCKVASVPGAKIRWYHEGGKEVRNNSVFNQVGLEVGYIVFMIPDTYDPIQDQEQRVVIVEQGTFDKTSELILTHVGTEASGDYSCVAQNKAGTAESNFTLQVGFFVGGVASLEDSEIAGIAVSFTFVAVLMLLIILLFIVRTKLSWRHREGSCLSRPKPSAEHKVVNGQNGVELNGVKNHVAGNRNGSLTSYNATGEMGSDGTIIINGTTYSMPTEAVTGMAGVDLIPDTSNHSSMTLRDETQFLDGGCDSAGPLQPQSSRMQLQSDALYPDTHTLHSPHLPRAATMMRPPAAASPLPSSHHANALYSPQLSAFRLNGVNTIGAHSNSPTHHWRGSGANLRDASYPPDFGLPTHAPDGRAFGISVNPMAEVMASPKSNMGGRSRSPFYPQPLPSYQESLAQNPNVMFSPHHLDTTPASSSSGASSSASSAASSAAPPAAPPRGCRPPPLQANSSSIHSPSPASSESRASPLKAGPQVRILKGASRESPDEGIQDDCSTDV